MEGTNSLFLLFFSWWYGYLPRRLYLAFIAVMLTTVDTFSVRILFRTLFSPWKRDVISTANLSLQQRFQVWMLNLASRIIGFFVKIFILATFVVASLAIIGLFAGLFLLWLAFPFLVVGLVIYGGVNYLNGGQL